MWSCGYKLLLFKHILRFQNKIHNSYKSILTTIKHWIAIKPYKRSRLNYFNCTPFEINKLLTVFCKMIEQTKNRFYAHLNPTKRALKTITEL